MTEFDIQIGQNIRHQRRVRGMKIQDLSDEIYKVTGKRYSANLISMWERGDRRLSCEHLGHICKGLGCTPNLVFPGLTIDTSDVLVQEFAAVPLDEQIILEYALTQWTGDKHALIDFMNLYMSLPRIMRQELAQTGLVMYDRGVKAGVVDQHNPPVQVEHIETAWKTLLEDIKNGKK
ncbi:MAG: helix-turn-helix domain-containing protein [Clostridia bacterium]|nr:helix-turn-helix domain-containing protein [Clostridia bacterium]